MIFRLEIAEASATHPMRIKAKCGKRYRFFDLPRHYKKAPHGQLVFMQHRIGSYAREMGYQVGKDFSWGTDDGVWIQANVIADIAEK